MFLPERSSPREQRVLLRLSHHASRTSATKPRSSSAGTGSSPTPTARCRKCAAPGVVGEQPVLEPGDAFEYTSYCPLKTKVGTMHGSYTMVTPDGETFEARDRAVYARRSERAELDLDPAPWHCFEHRGAPSMRTGRTAAAHRRAAAAGAAPPRRRRRRSRLGAAWREARELVWAHRAPAGDRPGADADQPARRPGPAGARPSTSIDEVIGKGRHELLLPIALAGGVATVVQAVTSLRPVADPRRGGAARHHRHAQARAGARSCACRCAISTRRRPACCCRAS